MCVCDLFYTRWKIEMSSESLLKITLLQHLPSVRNVFLQAHSDKNDDDDVIGWIMVVLVPTECIG